MENKHTLTQAHYRLLKDIEYGADISGYKQALLLREVESSNPEYLTITKAMGSYKAIDRIPYFGAIATEAGMQAAREKVVS